MAVSQKVQAIPGKPKALIALENQTIDMQGQAIVPESKELAPTQLMLEKAEALLKTQKADTSRKVNWGHDVPIWEKRWEKDDVRKKKFQDDYAAAKNAVSHIPRRNRQIVIEQSKVMAQSRMLTQSEVDEKARQESELLKVHSKETRLTLQQMVREQSQEKPVVYELDMNDIYSKNIIFSQILQFFTVPFDYKQDYKQYLKQFKSYQEFSDISKIYKQTRQNMIMFHATTAAGHQRAKQIQKANQFNQKTMDGLEFLINTASGSVYVPDDNFLKEFDKVDPKVRELVTMKVMDLGAKTKPRLYEILPCGESVDSVSFATEELARYKIKISKEFAVSQTWHPNKYYQAAQEYAVGHPKSAGKVQPEYNRCGYEIYLYKNVEKVLLFMLINLMQDPALFHDEKIMINSNEMIQLSDKFKLMLLETKKYTRKYDWFKEIDAFVDKRWESIIQVAVQKREKKIAADRIKRLEENQQDIPEDIRQKADQAIVEVDTSSIQFIYGEYCFDYAKGAIIRLTDAEIQRMQQEKEQKQREREEAVAAEAAEADEKKAAEERAEAEKLAAEQAPKEGEPAAEGGKDKEDSQKAPDFNNMAEVDFADPFADSPEAPKPEVVQPVEGAVPEGAEAEKPPEAEQKDEVAVVEPHKETAADVPPVDQPPVEVQAADENKDNEVVPDVVSVIPEAPSEPVQQLEAPQMEEPIIEKQEVAEDPKPDEIVEQLEAPAEMPPADDMFELPPVTNPVESETKPDEHSSDNSSATSKKKKKSKKSKTDAMPEESIEAPPVLNQLPPDMPPVIQDFPVEQQETVEQPMALPELSETTDAASTSGKKKKSKKKANDTPQQDTVEQPVDLPAPDMEMPDMLQEIPMGEPINVEPSEPTDVSTSKKKKKGKKANDTPQQDAMELPGDLPPPDTGADFPPPDMGADVPEADGTTSEDTSTSKKKKKSKK